MPEDVFLRFNAKLRVAGNTKVKGNAHACEDSYANSCQSLWANEFVDSNVSALAKQRIRRSYA
eukprot:1891106-Alexandrium_andersonii.AAC.1